MARNRAKEIFEERVVKPARQLNVDVEDVSADPSEGEVRGVVTIDTDGGERSLRLLFEREQGQTELTVTYERSGETVALEAEIEREENEDSETDPSALDAGADHSSDEDSEDTELATEES